MREHMNEERTRRNLGKRTWTLMAIDVFFLMLICLLVIYAGGRQTRSPQRVLAQVLALGLCVTLCRSACQVYRQVWRYAYVKAYLHLCAADALAAALYCAIGRWVMPEALRIPFAYEISICMLSLLWAMVTRFLYQYLRELLAQNRLREPYRAFASRLFGDGAGAAPNENMIRIAIVGAGRVGALLAEELQNNPRANYKPICFIEIDRQKIGKEIMSLPVWAEGEASIDRMKKAGVQEVVFALPQMQYDKRRVLYDRYKAAGFKAKIYDTPLDAQGDRGKPQVREFGIEELLYRKQLNFLDEKTIAYYKDKRVLVTGGGGSIGSEICRQIARMQPKQLVILDIYENNAYDIQQELRIEYGSRLDLQVEIASVRDEKQIDKVFRVYRPQIVIHAAAHKHVPLMEWNVGEAVKNNVFGTYNVVRAAERYEAEKFIMVSTDKAVNPTNAMGATKRMCEMIVQSRVYSGSKTSFSATRFGNVLGSNGSVIPLFRRQIANGGPITLTDKRVIRYFMMIPEASQLVLTSGAMAKSGELYVLDMGKPVKILDLAENMIRLSGYEPYKDIDIIETGLRPGEKLYEELLIKTEELDKTDSDMIFVERDKPLACEVIEEKLNVLRQALETEDDDAIRLALKAVVPTYHSPKHVNAKATDADEMKEIAARTQLVG